MRRRLLSTGTLIFFTAFSTACSGGALHHVNFVARFPDSSSVDRMAADLAARLHMQMTISGQGLFSPEWAHGIQVHNSRITFYIVPTAVDACTAEAVYDGKSYAIGISSFREDSAQDLLEAERELQNVVGNVEGTVHRRVGCDSGEIHH